jgi:hypothetical protein
MRMVEVVVKCQLLFGNKFLLLKQQQKSRRLLCGRMLPMHVVVITDL